MRTELKLERCQLQGLCEKRSMADSETKWNWPSDQESIALYRKEMSMFIDHSHYLQFYAPLPSFFNTIHAFKDSPIRRWKLDASIASQGSSSFNNIIVSFMLRGRGSAPWMLSYCSSMMQKVL